MKKGLVVDGASHAAGAWHQAYRLRCVALRCVGPNFVYRHEHGHGRKPDLLNTECGAR